MDEAKRAHLEDAMYTAIITERKYQKCKKVIAGLICVIVVLIGALIWVC